MPANRIEECPNCHKTGARRNLSSGALHCKYCEYREAPDMVTHQCAIGGCESTTKMNKGEIGEGQWVCHQHSHVEIGEWPEPKPGSRGDAWRPVTYVHFYTMLVPVARECGYALALHGTVQRDLDIIAVPWEAKPSSHIVLLESFCNALGIKKDLRVEGHHRVDKLHGRVSYTIPVMDDGWLDISVMPFKIELTSTPHDPGSFHYSLPSAQSIEDGLEEQAKALMRKLEHAKLLEFDDDRDQSVFNWTKSLPIIVAALKGESDPKAFLSYLEQHLIPKDRWDANTRSPIPHAARKVAAESEAEGVPTGIGWTEERGFYVLTTAGQGPVVIWPEPKERRVDLYEGRHDSDLTDTQIEIMRKVRAEPGVSLTEAVPEGHLFDAQELGQCGLIEGRSVAIKLGAEHGVRLYLTKQGKAYCEEHLT